MRLIHRDPSTGVHRLRLETPSDLWRIARLVRPGDIVGASTTRRDPEAPPEVAGAERTRGASTSPCALSRSSSTGSQSTSGHRSDRRGAVRPRPGTTPSTSPRATRSRSRSPPGPRATGRSSRKVSNGKGTPPIFVAAVDWGDSSLVRLRGRSVEPVVDLRRTIRRQALRGRTGREGPRGVHRRARRAAATRGGRRERGRGRRSGLPSKRSSRAV